MSFFEDALLGLTGIATGSLKKQDGEKLTPIEECNAAHRDEYGDWHFDDTVRKVIETSCGTYVFHKEEKMVPDMKDQFLSK